MNRKKIIVCVLMMLLSVKIFPQSMTLDEAIIITASELGQRINNSKIPDINFSDQTIEQTATEIRQQLTAQTKIAVLNFSSKWQELSSYVIDELNNAIVRNGSLTVVDRQQLDLLRQEQNFQMSGDVDDKSAQSIGKFLGAQSVLSGTFTVIGTTNRFRIRIIAVETGVVQYSNSLDIKSDSILTALMSKVQVPLKSPKLPRKPLVTDPVFSFVGDFGGGNIFGYEQQIGLQLGVSVNNLNILLDTVGGFCLNDNVDMSGCYYIGGLIEYGIAKMFFLGFGGGMGGNTFVTDDVYPYVRGSASVSFGSDIFGFYKLGAYCDYTFDYGFRFGFRIQVDFGNLLFK
jgi:TolB-like protein